MGAITVPRAAGAQNTPPVQTSVRLSRIAKVLSAQGLSDAVVGTRVHADAEAWTLSHWAAQSRAGKVLVEFRVEKLDGSHGEIDLVRIKKGNRHFIYDYKPVNLAELGRDPEFGAAFTAWLNDACDGDAAQFGFRHGANAMDPALRDFARERVSRQIHQHRAQLEAYRVAYARQLGDPRAEIPDPIVIPYWVWR